MAGWSPFGGSERGGELGHEIRSHSVQCVHCGILLIKGTRGIPTKRRLDDMRRHHSYPKYGGGISIAPTYVHPECWADYTKSQRP